MYAIGDRFGVEERKGKPEVNNRSLRRIAQNRKELRNIQKQFRKDSDGEKVG
jgi:hypothetical protein